MLSQPLRTASSSTSSAAGARVTSGDATPATRRVVDAPTRMFHWLFALCFVGAYVTADSESWRLLHVTLGYTLAGLLGFRLLYGLVGPRHARLSLMWRKVAGWPGWLASFKRTQLGSWRQVNWRQGQNLMMALAMVAMLLLVAPLTLSGYLNYNDLGGDVMEELHELVGNALLGLVLGHVGLVALLSVLRRKNQALPMLTGRTPGAGPDLVRHNARWLAALLLAAVLGYWAWEWQQQQAGSPQTMSQPAGGEQNGKLRIGPLAACLAFHWDCRLGPEMRSAFDHYRPRLAVIADSMRDQGFIPYAHSHPRWNGFLDALFVACGFEVLATDRDVFDKADMLIMDNSSLMYEFASLRRPVIALNAPWYRRDVEHGLRFWSHVPGVQVDSPEQLLELDLLSHLTKDPARALRNAAVAEAYASTDGGAAQRAAAWITQLLDSR